MSDTLAAPNASLSTLRRTLSGRRLHKGQQRRKDQTILWIMWYRCHSYGVDCCLVSSRSHVQTSRRPLSDHRSRDNISNRSSNALTRRKKRNQTLEIHSKIAEGGIFMELVL